MLYDIHLKLHYEYERMVRADRHLIRVMPVTIPAVQRVIAAALSFDPQPEHQNTFSDFFGNSVTTIAFTGNHDHLDVNLTARVQVDDVAKPADFSPDITWLKSEIAGLASLGSGSPHHFLGPSPRIPIDPLITAYAALSLNGTASVQAAVMDLCLRINKDFAYDRKATRVDTSPSEAFELRKGVCQDFSQVMIAGLRGLGIPAGYVSGFLRTIPPKGKPRLEGADAMHAWVRAWCGQTSGWIEFDPTNAMLAGPDHITIGHGRDYADISPIVGILRTSGKHKAKQSVDVVRID